MSCVVIDPPRQQGKYVYQEECCFSLISGWQVPARALHIATQLDAPYIPPLESWDEFASAVDQYDAAWMIYSFPLSNWLDVPQRVRGKITAVCNPHTCSASLDGAGFKATETTLAYGLDVAERLWPLFEGNHATIQVNSGCPFGCHYCVWNREAFPRKWLWADPKLVAELSNRAKNPYLICSQITGDHQWIDAFLTERKPITSDEFSTDLNCAHMPAYEHDIRRLAENGMRTAVVGTEAFSDTSLARLGCPHTVDQSRQMVKLLAELWVTGKYQLRYGYGETIEEIEENTRNLLRIAYDANLVDSPHSIHVGAIFYWHPSKLSESLATVNHVRHGVPCQVQAPDEERKQAWLRSYAALRDAGLRIV